MKDATRLVPGARTRGAKQSPAACPAVPAHPRTSITAPRGRGTAGTATSRSQKLAPALPRFYEINRSPAIRELSSRKDASSFFSRRAAEKRLLPAKETPQRAGNPRPQPGPGSRTAGPESAVPCRGAAPGRSPDAPGARFGSGGPRRSSGAGPRGSAAGSPRSPLFGPGAGPSPSAPHGAHPHHRANGEPLRGRPNRRRPRARPFRAGPEHGRGQAAPCARRPRHKAARAERRASHRPWRLRCTAP